MGARKRFRSRRADSKRQSNCATGLIDGRGHAQNWFPYRTVPDCPVETTTTRCVCVSRPQDITGTPESALLLAALTSTPPQVCFPHGNACTPFTDPLGSSAIPGTEEVVGGSHLSARFPRCQGEEDESRCQASSHGLPRQGTRLSEPLSPCLQ